MNSTRQRFPLDTIVSFHGSDCEITVWATCEMLQMQAQTMTELRLELRTDIETLRQIEHHGAFHNTPDVRLPAATEGFDPARPIVIEMRLDPKLLALLPTDPQAVAEMLRSAENAPPELFNASSWYLLNVKQAHGYVMTGYATTWFVS